MKKKAIGTPDNPSRDLAALVKPAIKRAAKRAREIARMHGTAIHFIRDGKIVSEKP